jgi:hypothetical protein
MRQIGQLRNVGLVLALVASGAWSASHAAERAAGQTVHSQARVRLIGPDPIVYANSACIGSEVGEGTLPASAQDGSMPKPQNTPSDAVEFAVRSGQPTIVAFQYRPPTAQGAVCGSARQLVPEPGRNYEVFFHYHDGQCDVEVSQLLDFPDDNDVVRVPAASAEAYVCDTPETGPDAV